MEDKYVNVFDLLKQHQILKKIDNLKKRIINAKTKNQNYFQLEKQLRFIKMKLIDDNEDLEDSLQNKEIELELINQTIENDKYVQSEKIKQNLDLGGINLKNEEIDDIIEEEELDFEILEEDKLDLEDDIKFFKEEISKNNNILNYLNSILEELKIEESDEI